MLWGQRQPGAEGGHVLCADRLPAGTQVSVLDLAGPQPHLPWALGKTAASYWRALGLSLLIFKMRDLN